MLALPRYLPGKAAGQLRPYDDRLQTDTHHYSYMNTVVSLSSLVSHRAFAFPFPPHAISTDTDALAPEWHMVAPPAGHHSRRERLGERARTTWGWATDQHLYMTPALARPRRAWPSPLATPVAACAGATECTLTAIAQHGAVHRFPQAS